MPLEPFAAAPQRIAVIGGGISGMAAAYLLSKSHQVVLYEAENRLGGHARTVVAGKRGDQPVDTGFIVFNHANYPHLSALFEELGVETAPSRMSFGASMDGGRLEYALHGLDAIFAQRRNFANPQFLRMLRDIVRFNNRAERLADDDTSSINDLLDRLGMGRWFREKYLYPFTGAIWSTPAEHMAAFPAQAMVRFMKNHALLGYSGQHQWHTVKGGSINYVTKLEARLKAQGVEIRKAAPIASVSRDAFGAMVAAKGSEAERFDDVIFATHSDDSLKMLADASQDEARALGAVKYQPNEAVLHADTGLMPKRRKVWASWVYSEAKGEQPDRIGLTYWMNSLQPIPHDDPLFVTLNSTRAIREELIYDTATFRHPVYDLGALQAQEAIKRWNGTNRTWFCGAWMRNGFHEDGFASAMDVALAIIARDEAKAAA